MPLRVLRGEFRAAQFSAKKSQLTGSRLAGAMLVLDREGDCFGPDGEAVADVFGRRNFHRRAGGDRNLDLAGDFRSGRP